VSDLRQAREEWAPLRHAGIVLLGIGLLVLGVTLAWNLSTATEGGSRAVPVEGILLRAYVEQVNSRTSIDEYILMDVERDGAREQWVLPAFSQPLADRVRHLETGRTVSARLEPDDKIARWSGDALRVAWSVEQGGVEIIPESTIRAAEAAEREFSPLIGIAVTVLGAALLVISAQAVRATGRRDELAAAEAAGSDRSAS